MNLALQTTPKAQADQNSGWGFLEKLNGNKQGCFARYLAEKKQAGRLPRIAWYPSSGGDMRDLLYLSPAFEERCQRPDANPSVEPPDLFLHTDSRERELAKFLNGDPVFKDDLTKIEALDIETLPPLRRPLSRKLAPFWDNNVATHLILFLWLRVSSKQLGEFTAPLLYMFSENCAFADFALKQGAQFSHVVHVRYGGINSSGRWMLNILRRLGCECLVSDDNYYDAEGDTTAMRIFPSLQPENPIVTRIPFRPIPEQLWSRRGEVAMRYRTR